MTDDPTEARDPARPGQGIRLRWVRVWSAARRSWSRVWSAARSWGTGQSWSTGRSWRQRALLAVAAVTGVVVVVVAAVVVHGGWPGAARPTPPMVAPRPSAPAGLDIPTVPDPRRVPATAEAVLELLTRLMHPMPVRSPAKSVDGRLTVQAYLDDGHGPGMIRLAVTPLARPAPCQAGAEPALICRRLPDGSRVNIAVVPDNCERSTSISVFRPSSVRIDLDVASCLAFDGTRHPAGRQTLSADQAVAVAADSRWGASMDPELVAAGAQHFRGVRRAVLPEPVAVVPAPLPTVIRPSLPGAGLSRAPVVDSGLQWQDVDGDRAVDYCRRVEPAAGGTGRVACTLSARSGFGRTVTSPVLDWGSGVGRDWADVDGDNRADFCRRLGSAGATTGRLACTLFTGTAFGSTITSTDLDLGRDVGWAWDDVDGDHKVDYCRTLSGVGGSGRLACTLSTGAGFGVTITSAELDLGRDVGVDWVDANGDGRVDYCRRLSGSARVACTLSTGAGFGVTITSAELDLGRDVGVDWVDANGDGRVDYCRRLSGSARVACTLSTGAGFGATITSPGLDFGQDDGVAWADVTTDQRADYCRPLGARTDRQIRLACTPSTGTGFGATTTSPPVERGQPIGMRWVDLNGDGRRDFCRRIGGPGAPHRLACTLTTGTGFGATITSGTLDWGLDN